MRPVARVGNPVGSSCETTEHEVTSSRRIHCSLVKDRSGPCPQAKTPEAEGDPSTETEDHTDLPAAVNRCGRPNHKKFSRFSPVPRLGPGALAAIPSGQDRHHDPPGPPVAKPPDGDLEGGPGGPEIIHQDHEAPGRKHPAAGPNRSWRGLKAVPTTPQGL